MLAQHGTGFWNGPGSKALESLSAQALEAGLLPERVEGRQGKLVQILGRIRSEDTAGRDGPTIDPHHSADKFRMPIEYKAYRRVGAAVRHDDYRLGLGSLSLGHSLLDRRRLVIERPGRPL
ncbi:hypothetical protein P9209_18810 [Prescottella defluvii]|nr:hypothetical protein P9209_18810 [Prescottella defluvii]